MNNKKKQTATLAMVTVLGVTNVASPALAVRAKNGNQVVVNNETALPSITLPENLQAIAGTTLQDVALPAQWSWVNENTTLAFDVLKYPARFQVDDQAIDYTNVEGYHAQGHYVERMLPVSVALTKEEPSIMYTSPQPIATGDIAIDASNFPDEAFRTFLSSQDYGKDGSISQEELSEITTLDISNQAEIKSLKGIENFTNLGILYCKYSGITELDVSKNLALQALSCYNTSITELDVSKNLALQALSCDNTKIEELDVSKNLALRSLSCKGTAITDLDVSKNLELVSLYCDDTEIEELDVSKNAALLTLGCHKTNVTDLDISKNKALSFLNCESTNITELDITQNLALMYLYLDDTKITSLDLSQHTLLKILSLNYVPLRFLNLGNNANLSVGSISSSETITVTVDRDTFNIKDVVAGIDASKVTITNGASYNATTGEVSDYIIGTPITYTYDCGTASNGKVELNVTLNLEKNGIAIDATNFPDEAFRTYLTSQNYGKDGVITKEEITKITTLDLTNQTEIKSLKGIEYFTNLGSLFCEGLGITDLDVGKNLALRVLFCNNTNITELDVSKNLALEALSCDNTKIEELDVSKNLALNSLFCEGTAITDLDVSKNLELKTLYCDDTKIEELDVSKNLALSDLTCNNTNITDLDVSNNLALISLGCSNTNITDLDVSKNTSLSSLNINNTKIANLDVNQNKKLVLLYLDDTKITSLDLSQHTSLKMLSCNDVPLRFLNLGNNANLSVGNISSSEITATVGRDTFNIKDVVAGIDASKITIKSGASYNATTGEVSGYTIGTPITYTYDCGTASNGKLELNVTLNLEDAGITIDASNFPDEAFRNFLKGKEYGQDGVITQEEISKITVLSLTNQTEIKSLKGIENFTNLKELYCGGLSITDLDVSKNTALEQLICSNTSITELDVSKNLALEILYCNDTSITELDISNNLALTKLFCGSTNITELDVSKNTALQELYCSETSITDLDVSKNLALIGLECNNTNITDLDISKNTALLYLNCDSTNITDLDVTQNKVLENLSLDTTKISSLNVTQNLALKQLSLYDTKITSLDLSQHTSLKDLGCDNVPLRFLNLGNNANLNVSNISSSEITVTVGRDTFNIKDVVAGIDASKVTITSGASYNATTGKVSDYTIGTPITYTYDCGTASNGKVELNVTLNLEEKLEENGIAITPENFPDEAFRTYLTSQNFGSDGLITPSEIEEISLIDVKNNAEIKSLEGIEYFTELFMLDCSNTGITSLDVSKNTALNTLDCENNALGYLNIGTNHNLLLMSSKVTPTILKVSGNTFKIQDKFAGIDTSKVTITSGASYDPLTGEVSGYTIGTPIVYTYASGTSANGEAILTVTLNLEGTLTPEEKPDPGEKPNPGEKPAPEEKPNPGEKPAPEEKPTPGENPTPEVKEEPKKDSNDVIVKTGESTKGLLTLMMALGAGMFAFIKGKKQED